jgi:hypothetical protein
MQRGAPGRRADGGASKRVTSGWCDLSRSNLSFGDPPIFAVPASKADFRCGRAPNSQLRTFVGGGTARAVESIFVEADEPLLIFPSIKVAEWYLEAEDVRSGVYPRAYGSTGEQFVLETHGRRVVVRPSVEPADPNALARLLRRHLAAVGVTVSDDVDLPELIAAAEAFWEERDPTGDRFSRSIPWWGCLLIVAVIAGVMVLLWRLVHGS